MVCGGRRVAKFDFSMDMAVALWEKKVSRQLSNRPRTSEQEPGKTKDSERRQILGVMDVDRYLSPPHC